jgi:hypothetical protein
MRRRADARNIEGDDTGSNGRCGGDLLLGELRNWAACQRCGGCAAQRAGQGQMRGSGVRERGRLVSTEIKSYGSEEAGVEGKSEETASCGRLAQVTAISGARTMSFGSF